MRSLRAEISDYAKMFLLYYYLNNPNYWLLKQITIQMFKLKKTGLASDFQGLFELILIL